MAGDRASAPFVLSDVDGTLLLPDHTLGARTIRAGRALVEAGGAFALATGRMPSGTQAIREQLGVAMSRICYSGALVLDEHDAVLYQSTLPADLARDVLDTLAYHWPQVSPSYFCGLAWYAQDPDAPGIGSGARLAPPCPLRASFSELLDAGRLPSKIFCSRSFTPQQSLEMRALLMRRFPQLNVIRSANGAMVEVMMGDVSKQEGARHLLAAHGLALEDAVAFGDDENDVGLLAAAGTGVAMGNASPAARRAADLVCETCAEQGVARTLERMLGLE